MSKKTERAAIVGDLIIKTDGMVEVEQHPSLNARVTLMDDGYAWRPAERRAVGPVENLTDDELAVLASHCCDCDGHGDDEEPCADLERSVEAQDEIDRRLLA